MGNDVVPEDRWVVVADLDGAGSVYCVLMEADALTLVYRPSCKSATTTNFKDMRCALKRGLGFRTIPSHSC